LLFASRAAGVLDRAGLDPEPAEEDDEPLWAAQREAQRAAAGAAVVRVAGLPSRLAEVLEAAAAAGADSAVGRAALGLTWISLPAGADAAAGLAELRRRLGPLPVVLQEGPEELRAAVDPWGVPDGPALDLMRRVKVRFDPAGTCSPGVFAGGI